MKKDEKVGVTEFQVQMDNSVSPVVQKKKEALKIRKGPSVVGVNLAKITRTQTVKQTHITEVNSFHIMNKSYEV